MNENILFVHLRLTFFAHHDTLHRKPKRLHPNLARTHTAIQQRGRIQNQCPEVAFLYTNNETEEREIKESVPFIIAPKKDKIPRNKPNQKCKDLNPKSYRKLLKVIEEDIKRCKNIPGSWIGRINIVKILMLLEVL